jgi:hypothetical protein
MQTNEKKFMGPKSDKHQHESRGSGVARTEIRRKIREVWQNVLCKLKVIHVYGCLYYQSTG